MQHANKSFGAIKRYCAANLYLVAIAPVNGKPTKAPRAKGWNQPKDLSNPGGYSADADDFKDCNGSNIGLYHGASDTLALDLDDVELACKIFDELTGNQLIDWLKDPLRVEIKSPKANRGKLLFKLPTLTQSVGLRQFKHDGKVIFELRCGNCQDVIYGQHPEGGDYQFIGNPAEIPLIPDVLLNMLQHWDDWKSCFDSVLGITKQPPKIQPRKPQQGENLPGRRNPIELFNQAKGGVVPVLLDNGYKQLGSNRLVRPGSESKAPGIVILRECADGIERVFSHGGDVLNDGFAHDAWDCYRLLQCAGDSTQALNWDPAITKHNQRLFMQEKAKTAAQTPATDNPKKTAEAKLPKTQRTLPDGTALNDQHINILEQLNRDYAHTVLGGKNVIVGQRVCQVQGSVFTFEAPAEFKKKFLHESLIGEGKRKNQGQAWLEWPGKNYMPHGVGFYPDPKKCPAGMFNLFSGYQVKPVAGDCSIYLNHLKHIICAGDDASYSYLIGWLAHLFQQPDVKNNVAIMLKSVEGTGKGTMAEPLLEILGVHGNKTNGAYAIANRFNGTLACRLLIFADEVDLTDKHVADRLKGIITETSVNMERKGLEIEPIPNYCRLIFASNHTRVLNAGIRERRYLVLEPSDEKAQDTAYFKSLWAWIKDGGAAKLLHYLLQVDISRFDPYKCPQTKALIAEKLANLSGINRFFYEQIVMKDELFGGKARIFAADLVDDFVAWSRDDDDVKIHKPAARNMVGKMMVRLGITVGGRSDRGEGKCYDLPERKELITSFAKLLDVPEDEL